MFEVFAYSDFYGNWNKLEDPKDISTVKLCTCHDIIYVRCPILWTPDLQTQRSLITTKSDYIAILQSLTDFIPVMLSLEKRRERLVKPFHILKTFITNHFDITLVLYNCHIR